MTQPTTKRLVTEQRLSDAVAAAIAAPADPAIASAVTTSGSQTQTALDGRYRKKGDLFLSVKDYGAKGDGTTDDTTAIQAAFNAAGSAKGVVIIPPSTSTYNVTAQLVLPSDASLVMDGATIKATAAITGAVIKVGDLTNWWRNKFMRGGYIDCNNNADHAVEILSARNVDVDYVTWTNPKMHGLILGNTGAALGSHEIHLTKCFGDKTPDVARVAGSIGIWMTTKCFDSVATDCVIIGAEVSFQTDGSANTHVGGHGYGITASVQFPHTVFKDSGSDNIYVACYPDTPTNYGFWFTSNSYRWTVLGGRVINNPSIGLDNVITGIHSDLADPNTGAIIGIQMSGGATARISKDYDQYNGSQNLRILGCSDSFVTTTNLRVDNITTGNIRRLKYTGSAPIVAAGAGAGTGAPAPTLGTASRDHAGSVRFGTGTGPVADGVLATVTFNLAFSIVPFVTLTPMNTTTAKLRFYVDNVTTSTFDIKCADVPAASLAATALQLAYAIGTSG